MLRRVGGGREQANGRRGASGTGGVDVVDLDEAKLISPIRGFGSMRTTMAKLPVQS